MTEKQQQLQKSFVDEEGTEDVTEEEAMQMFKDAATESKDKEREVAGISSSTLPPYKKDAVGELFFSVVLQLFTHFPRTSVLWLACRSRSVLMLPSNLHLPQYGDKM